jgi:hypothetical protein
VTPEQFALLPLWIKLGLVGGAVLAGLIFTGFVLYKATSWATAKASAPIREAAIIAARETVAQTGMLDDLKRTGESTARAVGDLSERFTVGDLRAERLADEHRKWLIRHDETLKTHADAIQANTNRFKPIEDTLARVETVVNMRRADGDLGRALVHALAPDPQPQSPPPGERREEPGA